MSLENITRARVRDALRRVGRGRGGRPTPLADLEAVRRALVQAGFRPTPEARLYELDRLLTELVEDRLRALRRVLGGPVPEDRADPHARIRADFGHAHLDLEALSAVHHLYLRPDLDLDLDGFVALLGDRHRRTVQRRLHRGVQWVADGLRDLEREAAIAARKERALRQLPPPNATRIFGRTGLAAELARRLLGDEGRGLALAGPGGIGKSTLAWVLAERLALRGAVDEVAWVDARGRDPEEIVRTLARRLGMGSRAGAAELRAGLAGRRRLLVLDGLDEPCAAFRMAALLADAPPEAAVLLSGRVGWAGSLHVRGVMLPPLARDDGLRMLRHLTAHRGPRARDAPRALARLADICAGHPGAIVHAAARLRARHAEAVAEEIRQGRGLAAAWLDSLYGAGWDALRPEARAMARAAAESCAAGRLPDETALARRAGLDAVDAAEALGEALDAGLVLDVDDPLRRGFRPPQFFGRFLAGRAEAARPLRGTGARSGAA